METPLEIRQILGRNLRLLTSRKGTITSVSKEIGIGRVQYGRYVAGQSFPRPDTLKRICDYFNVDARIVLEEIDRHSVIPSMQLSQYPRNLEMEEMISFVSGGKSYRVREDQIPNGIHRYWKQSFVKRDRIVTGILRVYELNQCRVIRGYEASEHKMLPTMDGGNAREIRAALLDVGSGFVVQCFSANTRHINFISCGYNDSIYSHLKSGISVWASQSGLEVKRVSRYVFEVLQQDTKTVLQAARESGYYDLCDVPAQIRELIEIPIT